MFKSTYFFLSIPAIFIFFTLNGAQNAGVLPYAKKNDIVFFLFGLEHRQQDVNRGWAKKAGTTWVLADFGGKCDVEDTKDASKYGTDQATLCAAREAAEETRYVFGNNLPLKSGLTKKSSEFDKSVRYFINHMTQVVKIDGYYDQFFAEVDFIDANLFKNSPKVPNYEKEDYTWVKAGDLLKALQNPDPNGFSKIGSTLIYPTLAKTLRRADVLNFINSLIVPKKTVTVGILPSARINNHTLFLTQQQTSGYSAFDTVVPEPIDVNKLAYQALQPYFVAYTQGPIIQNQAQNYVLVTIEIPYQDLASLQALGFSDVAWIDSNEFLQLLNRTNNTVRGAQGEKINLDPIFADTLRLPQAYDLIKPSEVLLQNLYNQLQLLLNQLLNLQNQLARL